MFFTRCAKVSGDFHHRKYGSGVSPAIVACLRMVCLRTSRSISSNQVGICTQLGRNHDVYDNKLSTLILLICLVSRLAGVYSAGMRFVERNYSDDLNAYLLVPVIVTGFYCATHQVE